ncbi:hypothetical protein [Anaplasma phagocytophilum]|uniref:hypothetical protein n=1 Tax=Anaplasma phagocytophilum TaxID=948 RepID=UPI0039779E5E
MEILNSLICSSRGNRVLCHSWRNSLWALKIAMVLQGVDNVYDIVWNSAGG